MAYVVLDVVLLVVKAVGEEAVQVTAGGVEHLRRGGGHLLVTGLHDRAGCEFDLTVGGAEVGQAAGQLRLRLLGLPRSPTLGGLLGLRPTRVREPERLAALVLAGLDESLVLQLAQRRVDRTGAGLPGTARAFAELLDELIAVAWAFREQQQGRVADVTAPGPATASTAASARPAERSRSERAAGTERTLRAERAFRSERAVGAERAVGPEPPTSTTGRAATATALGTPTAATTMGTPTAATTMGTTTVATSSSTGATGATGAAPILGTVLSLRAPGTLATGAASSLLEARIAFRLTEARETLGTAGTPRPPAATSTAASTRTRPT